MVRVMVFNATYNNISVISCLYSLKLMVPTKANSLSTSYGKPKRQSKMDNPEKLVPLGSQDTGRRQTKQTNTTQKTIKDEQHGTGSILG
jgi:phosphatidylinositol kinase/protein kinase (PI-3  family)